MSFFADTNIALGYTIIHDKWHENAKKLIDEKSDTIFWSNLVEKEYNVKLDNIFDDIDIFLKSTEKILRNNQKNFLNYYDFEEHILKRTKRCRLDINKKQKILEHFWSKYSLIEVIAQILYLNFRNYNKNFKKLYYMRDKKLNNILILHNCGLNNYLKYLDYAEKLYEWGVNKPDCKIVIDAHDCGLIHPNLIFVSTDKRMIDLILEHNTEFLNIFEFKSCN